MNKRPMKVFLPLVSSSIIVSSFLSCGTSNLNKIFGSKDESYASLLDQAQFAYDQGDFSNAEKLANKAYSKSDNNGDAGVLLGSIYLSQAGIDIYQMVGKIASLSSSSSSSTSSSTDSCSQSSSTSQSAGNLLSELSCKLLNLTDADKEALGTTQNFPGLSSVGITNVYVPTEVDDTLRANVSVLSALDKGIRKLCPFIDRTIVLSQSIDERHLDESICPNRTSTKFSGPKAHIAFALLHLVESLVFQQGILIDGVSSASSTTSRTGVQSISTKMSTATFSSITTFASAMSEFKNVVDAVFDTSNPKAQLALALNGFVMVSQSFEAAGVPSSVTSVITNQLANLKKTASTLKGGSTAESDSTYQKQALKGQMNEAYAKSMAEKINKQCPTASSCASDKASLCSSYSGISQGVDPAKKTTPTICQ